MMLPAYISHADCHRHEMGTLHPECPERLDAIHDHLLIQGLLDCMAVHDAPLASDAQLLRAHTEAHLAWLSAGNPKQVSDPCRQIDPDTWINPYTLDAARRAAGAAVLATDLVVGGEAQVAFCNVRPPGHHAGRHSAAGFCFFNNVVIGMLHALEAHGLERVALIDFDAHHGNGTENIIAGDERMLMCSIFGRDLYPYSGSEPTGDNLCNVPLMPNQASDVLHDVVTGKWLPRLDAFKPQMLFISAGFDAHRLDEMGSLGLVEADYAWMTAQVMAVAERHAQGRVVSCLEGGYELGALARSVGAHVKVLIGAAA